MFTGHFWPLFTQCCQEPGIQVCHWNCELPFNLRLILRNTKTKLLAAQQASSRQVVHPSIPGMANGLWTSALRLSQSRSDLYRLRAFRFHAHTRTLFNLQPQHFNSHLNMVLFYNHNYIQNSQMKHSRKKLPKNRSTTVFRVNLLSSSCSSHCPSQSRPDFHRPLTFADCIFQAHNVFHILSEV